MSELLDAMRRERRRMEQEAHEREDRLTIVAINEAQAERARAFFGPRARVIVAQKIPLTNTQ